MELQDIQPLLCGHGLPARSARGFKAVCPACGSFWDTDYLGQDFTYDESYPRKRGHFSPRIGALKVRTLKRWLAKTRTETDGLRVCEVGFGGAYCLAELAARARSVVGIEAGAAALEHANWLGIRATLLDAERLPDRLAEPIDLWIFQDSFEHIPDPKGFVSWLADNSSEVSRVLLVAPQAGSLSDRLLGRAWPHKIVDHRFHWSKAGIIEFWSHFGFQLVDEFRPLKYVSPRMAIAHLAHKFGFEASDQAPALGDRLAIPFNFGEMGLLFRRSP